MSETPSGAKTPPAVSPSPPPPNESLDLSAWAGSHAKAEPTPTEQRRPRDPKVEWGKLAGISGLAIVRIWTGVTSKDGKDYPWVGATVRLPPTKDFPQGKNVFALTAIDTVAGADLMRGLRSGVFDTCDPTHPVAVHVRTAMNPDYPHGRPMAFLTLG
jgi:hypothetical protein